MRVDTLSLVRPLPWARAVAGLRFTPDRWGPGVFRIEAPGGAHLFFRRHGSSELALWLPADLAPEIGEPFGLYLHADRHHADRLRAVNLLTRYIGSRSPQQQKRLTQAHRQVAMLCVHDLARSGASLRDIGVMLIDSMPNDWRTSSERSDLRRLHDEGVRMVSINYRSLLGRRNLIHN